MTGSVITTSTMSMDPADRGANGSANVRQLVALSMFSLLSSEQKIKNEVSPEPVPMMLLKVDSPSVGRIAMGENEVSIDEWNEQLRCPNCRKTGFASLSQGKNDDASIVHSVPDGFKVVITEHGPDFICAACGVAVEP